MTGMAKYGKTQIVVCEDYERLGRTAAEAVATRMRQVLQQQAEMVIVFAAAESQTTFFKALARIEELEWNRVTCVNMDDFWDPRIPEEFTCGHQARRLLYDVVHPKAWHVVTANAPDPNAEADRFEKLLRSFPALDVVCQGIGTSGHLALNEPGDCTFDDPRWVRVVNIAEQSKKQLRIDPNFRELGYIPEQGITMTLPALCAGKRLFTIVPLAIKRPIVTRVLNTPLPTESLPASLLSQREGILFLDRDSCPADWPEARHNP